jgi:hypothetical protein
MIVRILGDHIYEVPQAELPEIERLDAKLDAALTTGDEDGFSTTLAELIAKVRGACAALDDSDDRKSDLVLPHEGATLQEVRDILDKGEDS